MLNGVPSQVTVTYISTPPSTTATVVISIPTPSAGTPMEVTSYIAQIFKQGFFTFLSGTNPSVTAVPVNQIVSIVAG
jgi:hypothetical protein